MKFPVLLLLLSGAPGASRDVSYPVSVHQLLASVECVVQSAGNLSQVIDLAPGDLVRFDSFEAGTTDILLKDEVLLTGLWSQLQFPAVDTFAFEGKTSGARFEIDVRAQARLQTLDYGELKLDVQDQAAPDQPFRGSASLFGCLQLR